MKKRDAEGGQFDGGRGATVRQLTTCLVLMVVVLLLIPVGISAAPSGPLVFVADPDDTDNRAHVDDQGNLQVTGDLNVANTPTVKAQQDGEWDVGVSGTVDVGNFPETQDVDVVSGSVTNQAASATTSRNESFAEFDGIQNRDIAPIDASLITVTGTGDDELLIAFTSTSGVEFTIGDFDENLGPFVSIPLAQPIPIDHIFMQCENESDDCGAIFIDIVGVAPAA